MNIVFFGTPKFAKTILESIHQAGHQIVAIVTRTDKPKGRSGTPVASEVKLYAQEHLPNVPLYQPERASDPEFIEILRQYSADLFVVAAYGEIIKQALLDMPKLCCINVHGSLLPAYRGAAPIQQSIIDGCNKTGITIIRMVRKMDAGDIICTEECTIDPNMTYSELERALAKIGCKALLHAIDLFAQNKVHFTPQDESLVTYAHKIEQKDCFIEWDSKSAEDIHNLVRGVQGYLGAWCFAQIHQKQKRVKILKTALLPASGEKFGHLYVNSNGNLCIAAKNGDLELQEIQFEGKTPISGKEAWRSTSFTLIL